MSALKVRQVHDSKEAEVLPEDSAGEGLFLQF
jgi:hypothetical protein